jgi:hypothetical protein
MDSHAPFACLLVGQPTLDDESRVRFWGGSLVEGGHDGETHLAGHPSMPVETAPMRLAPKSFAPILRR